MTTTTMHRVAAVDPELDALRNLEQAIRVCGLPHFMSAGQRQLELLAAALKCVEVAREDLKALSASMAKLSPTEQSLTQVIADEAARSDIECHCMWTSEDPALRWFDTSKIEDESREKHLRVFVDRAVEYLSLRGLLVLHAEHGYLVRFKEMA